MNRAYPTRDWPVEDGRWRQYLWGYYRMTELVDAYIGQVLEVLRASGQEENTVVVFTSDHGDGMGSHRWNQKTIFYDEIARVPFVLSWKGRTKPCGRNRDHLVNIGTDLFPTLFEFAGITAPPGLRGISAAPAALGEGDPAHRDFIVSENNHHSGFGNPTNVHGRMVRSRRYKYIRYNQGEPSEQLFDLELDPGETRDLTRSTEAYAALIAHRRMLSEYVRETGDPFPPLDFAPLVRSLEYGGQKRDYFVALPDDFDAEATYWPLVVVHGGGGNARKNPMAIAMRRLSDELGLPAILILPEFITVDKQVSRFPVLGEAGFLKAVLEQARTEFKLHPQDAVERLLHGGTVFPPLRPGQPGPGSGLRDLRRGNLDDAGRPAPH